MTAPEPVISRPKPRPRPRPRLATTVSDKTRSEGASQKAGSSKSPIQVVEDEDAMFMRNTSRGMMSRQRIEEVIEKREALLPKLPLDSGESESEQDVVTPRRCTGKKQKSKIKPLPAWVSNGARNKLLDSSDEEEKSEDSLYILDDTPNEKSGKTPQTKRRRQRSRSPSLTPPPPVPKQKIQTAQNIIRKALGNSSPQRLPPSIAIEDDSDDELIALAPELAKISADYKGKRLFSRQPSVDRNALDNTTDPTLSAEVTLQIKWLPHPEDEAGKIEVWEFKQKRGDTFRALLEEIADEAGILSSDLKLTLNGIHVYPVSTPHSLGIWSEAHLEACTSNTREYIDNQKKARALSPSLVDDQRISGIGSGIDVYTSAAIESASESDASQPKEDDDKFKLHLRSGDKTIVVTVRPATKCGSIVATFLRKTGRPATLVKKVFLEIDGEKMDPDSPIGDAELEDGDLVDIVGL